MSLVNGEGNGHEKDPWVVVRMNHVVLRSIKNAMVAEVTCYLLRIAFPWLRFKEIIIGINRVKINKYTNNFGEQIIRFLILSIIKLFLIIQQ